MMTEIIREFTAIKKKTIEITSEQVLTWTRRAEAQRAHKVLLEVTKENKDFDNMKKELKNQKAKNNTLGKMKAGRREMYIYCKYCGAYMSARCSQPIAGAVQDVGNSSTLSVCAGVRGYRCQRITKDEEQFMNMPR